MSELTLSEQSYRYLNGEITIGQLDSFVSERVIEEFRNNRRSAESKLVDFLVGSLAEYSLDKEQLGVQVAEEEFQQNLTEYLTSDSFQVFPRNWDYYILPKYQGTYFHQRPLSLNKRLSVETSFAVNFSNKQSPNPQFGVLRFIYSKPAISDGIISGFTVEMPRHLKSNYLEGQTHTIDFSSKLLGVAYLDEGVKASSN